MSFFTRTFRYLSIYGGSGLFCSGATLYYLSKSEQEKYGNAKWETIESNPKKLVTTGPYKISRNPVYLSYIIMTLSFGVLSLHKIFPKYYPYGKLIILPLIIPTSIVYIFFLAVINYEENKLKLKFGSQYIKYSQSVNRWVGSQ